MAADAITASDATADPVRAIWVAPLTSSLPRSGPCFAGSAGNRATRPAMRGRQGSGCSDPSGQPPGRSDPRSAGVSDARSPDLRKGPTPRSSVLQRNVGGGLRGGVELPTREPRSRSNPGAGSAARRLLLLGQTRLRISKVAANSVLAALRQVAKHFTAGAVAHLAEQRSGAGRSLE
jgi:hypothetical protein